MNNIKLFENNIIALHDNDKRTFEEYEQSLKYDFLQSIDDLVNLDKEHNYIFNGCHDNLNNLAVLIYGYDNNIQTIKNKNGFQILNITTDKRLFDNNEINNVWLSAFIKQIKNKQKYLLNPNRNDFGITEPSYLYDYIWLVVNNNNIIPYEIINKTFKKINNNNDNLNYYILWLK